MSPAIHFTQRRAWPQAIPGHHNVGLDETCRRLIRQREMRREDVTVLRRLLWRRYFLFRNDCGRPFCCAENGRWILFIRCGSAEGSAILPGDAWANGPWRGVRRRGAMEPVSNPVRGRKPGPARPAGLFALDATFDQPVFGLRHSPSLSVPWQALTRSSPLPGTSRPTQPVGARMIRVPRHCACRTLPFWMRWSRIRAKVPARDDDHRHTKGFDGTARAWHKTDGLSETLSGARRRAGDRVGSKNTRHGRLAGRQNFPQW